MANYKGTVESSMSPEEAFDYLADFSNAPDWDPNTVSSDLKTPEAFMVGAKYDVVTKFAGRNMDLLYETVELDRPHRVVFSSGNGSTDITDTITFKPTATGTDVTYDANIAPKGFAKVLDPALTLIFKRVGDKAIESLRLKLKARQPS